MGRRWVDVNGDQLIDVEDEIADTLSESGTDDDDDNTEEIIAFFCYPCVLPLACKYISFSNTRNIT